MNTMQEEFDAVVAHLYKQGRPAKAILGGGPACFYRTPDRTLSCAVGCRIPDDKYDQAMDVPTGNQGTSVDTLIKRFKDSLPPEIAAYESMFDSLQSAHDGCSTEADGKFLLSDLQYRLSRVARQFDLTFTVPQG